MRSLTLRAAIGLPALSRGAVQFTEAALPLPLADKAERSVQQLWNFGEEGYGAVGLHGAGSVESCEAWAFKAQLVRLRYSGLDSRASRRNNVAIGSSQFWQPGAAFVARLPGSTGPSVSWMQKALKIPVSHVQFGAAGSPLYVGSWTMWKPVLSTSPKPAANAKSSPRTQSSEKDLYARFWKFRRMLSELRKRGSQVRLSLNTICLPSGLGPTKSVAPRHRSAGTGSDPSLETHGTSILVSHLALSC